MSSNNKIIPGDLFCSLCQRYFRSKRTLNEHVKEHSEDDGQSAFMQYVEPFICVKCNKTFEVKSDLMIHYNTICLDALYLCKHCLKGHRRSADLEMHLKDFHKYTEDMLMDENLFSSNSVVHDECFPENDIIELVSTAESKDIGKKTNEKKESIAKTSGWHRKNSKPKKMFRIFDYNLRNKNYVCEVCGDSFSRKCILDLHIVTHGEQRKHKNLVSNDFSTNVCKDAVQIDRKIGPRRPFLPRRVKEQKANLTNNIIKPSNIVLGSSIWRKCQPKSKSQNIEASISKKGKTSKKSSKSKSVKNPLKEQNMKPLATKTYTCLVCNKVFNDGYKLRRHHIIHTGERPYSCQKCDKNFARSDHLKRHSFICSKYDKVGV